MANLNQTQKQNIAEAIRQAESRTSGEFIAVLTRASDDYYFIPLLWAALLALIVPSLLLLLHLPLPDYSLMQMGVFILVALLFQWQPIKLRLIPRAVKQRRASLLAHEQFLLQGLHHTEGRNGILLFVSTGEHYVEIIADKGINEAVAADTWDAIVQTFVQRVQLGQMETGFIEAIAACGEVLAQHFPAQAQNPNELPNHLIELE